MKLIVHSATPKQLSRSANPNHSKTGKLVHNLRPCGRFWPKSSKFSSLKEMTQVFLRLTPVHKFLASRIEETALENQCSNLPLLKADSCLHLLHLICVFVMFLMKCCSRSSLKPARPMCDGRPFASPLLCRLAGRGSFFCGFPFQWVLHFALFLTRCLTVQDVIPCSGEVLPYECDHSCHTSLCLFFTALRLQRSQSMLVQETWQLKDIDFTSYKTLLTKSITCLPVGPMSLEWLVALPAGSDQYIFP